MGVRAASGYGYRDGMPAHRYVYKKLIGEIPAAKILCHVCDVRECVNPQHMFVGTQSDNIRDMHRKGRGRKAKQKIAANITPKRGAVEFLARFRSS